MSRVKYAENEAVAIGNSIRISPSKINLVCGLIRGKKINDALNTLTFSKRRIANDVKRVLQSAIANAENNNQLDVDKLFVKEAWVSKGLVMKRMHARARGRSGRIEKFFSNLTIVVKEKEGE